MVGRALLVVVRTLRSATGGASEWRPPLVWCRAVPLRRASHHRRPPSTPRAGPAGPRHARQFLRALRRATAPGLAAGANYLKAGARAGDRLRQQLKGSHSPHHRARAAAGVPAALRQHVAAAASPVSVIGLPSSDELGDRCGLRGRGQRRAGSPLRSGAECGSRLKALPAGPGLAPARCGSKFPGARARHRPRRGVGCQFESSVFPSLCSTFFSRVSP